ncbi:MAG TPA: cytochrome C oxidase subunit IV family protein [Dokdonella sp.]|uniref:cytochrome o ubiquinol oxidase subunit IV n=1 Tax=Dokdonella sp. TaxID=2291710 RepID=UPI002D7F7802|nr:cytochrome C oxidase subunit IV family protein [Dokdonella sp.]HET9032568.1 cytochrome C oxidase subunit IV family protein [Dokdonella sp.]
MARMIDQADAEYVRDLRAYILAFVIALVLTVIPFALVAWKLLSASLALVLICVCGLIQIVVHLRFFLHIGFQSHRDDLYLMLFSGVIILLLAGGTLIVMLDLGSRMM